MFHEKTRDRLHDLTMTSIKQVTAPQNSSTTPVLLLDPTDAAEPDIQLFIPNADIRVIRAADVAEANSRKTDGDYMNTVLKGSSQWLFKDKIKLEDDDNLYVLADADADAVVNVRIFEEETI